MYFLLLGGIVSSEQANLRAHMGNRSFFQSLSQKTHVFYSAEMQAHLNEQL